MTLIVPAAGNGSSGPAKCSKYVENAYNLIRTKVEKLEDDRLIGEDMLAIAELILEKKFEVN